VIDDAPLDFFVVFGKDLEFGREERGDNNILARKKLPRKIRRQKKFGAKKIAAKKHGDKKTLAGKNTAKNAATTKFWRKKLPRKITILALKLAIR
jgi:hypothetical protein